MLKEEKKESHRYSELPSNNKMKPHPSQLTNFKRGLANKPVKIILLECIESVF